MEPSELKNLADLTDKQLRAEANEYFAKAQSSIGSLRTSLLTKARFFLDEIESRANSRIARRDLLLEIAVILLIGGEIWIGIYEGNKQIESFNKMQGTLTNLQKSSEATADTLTALQKTTESMNQAVQQELGLYYDVSILSAYSVATKEMKVINKGRTNITLAGFKVADTPANVDKEGRLIPPGTGYSFNSPGLYDYVVQKLPHGTATFVPFEIYVRNDRSEKFVVHSYFDIRWNGDVPLIDAQTGSVVPGHWPKK